jgi:adenosylcobinamide-phosphate synthase
VLLAAVALDLAFGEPPDRVHPVAWLGRALGAGRRRWCRGSRPSLLLRGAGVTLAVAALAGLAGGLLHALAARLGTAGLALEAGALALLLSVRGLVVAARRVAAHLRRGDLVAARESVGRDLVSRRTDELDPGRVASAAAESVAENLTDAFVAPACFYLVFGLAGAAVYRAVNTADAMFGYREGPLEYFGKVAARLDDALNFLPARLAGWCIVLAAGLAGESAGGALAVMRRDRGLTASPNAGWTMAAMAGALGVTLEKPGAYRLGAGPLPDAAAIERANKVLAVAVAVSSAGLVAGAGLLARLVA